MTHMWVSGTSELLSMRPRCSPTFRTAPTPEQGWVSSAWVFPDSDIGNLRRVSRAVIMGLGTTMGHYGCAFIELRQLEVVVLNGCNYRQFVGKNPYTEKHLANPELDLEKKRR